MDFCSVSYHTGISFQFGEIKVTPVEKTIVGKLKDKTQFILSVVQQPAGHISTVIGSWSALNHLIKAIILGFNGLFLLLQYQEASAETRSISSTNSWQERTLYLSSFQYK